MRCCLWAVALTTAAWAGPKQAEPHVDAAYDHFLHGEYEAAVAAFRAAYVADPQPRHLLNIALSHGKLRDGCADALAAFDQFFEACGAACELRAAAQVERDAHALACRARVAVDSDPAQARVLLDGEPRGRTPAALDLPPGDDELRLERPGYRTVQRRLKAGAGTASSSS